MQIWKLKKFWLINIFWSQKNSDECKMNFHFISYKIYKQNGMMNVIILLKHDNMHYIS